MAATSVAAKAVFSVTAITNRQFHCANLVHLDHRASTVRRVNQVHMATKAHLVLVAGLENQEEPADPDIQ
jgi:hypothetical protein